MGTTYRVRLGGTPPDTGTTYYSARNAERAAVRLAKAEARERGDNPRTVALWGRCCDSHDEPIRLRSGRHVRAGACPDGDDGAYYAIIEEVR